LITGYYDTFARTVSNGFGTSTSGHAYTVNSTASQFNVTGGAATILPSTSNQERAGYVDRQTSDIDITGQVALSGVPATNLMTVGFMAKRDAGGNNYYTGTMMVATGGAVSLRFSKVIAGGLSTIATVSTGLTYVANTFYNLRVVVFWSDALQANVLRSKLWAVGGTEPGGWTVSTTDSSLTQYAAGTLAGLFARDEATTAGTVTAKIQNVVAKTYSLPIPAGTDTMCQDPAIGYPDQTALQSLAVAADAAMVPLDARASLAGLFPRVRVSNTNFTFGPLSVGSYSPVFTTTEFNVGTDTNLSYSASNIYLPQGIWLVTFEIEMASVSSSSDMQLSMSGGSTVIAGPIVNMRINATNANDGGEGGSAHFSYIATSTDPSISMTIGATLFPSNSSATYTVKYCAMSAVKISDYFT